MTCSHPHSGDMPRPPAPPGWDACAVCGCWEMAACWSEESGACSRIEEDLCSHRAERLDADPVLTACDDETTCDGRPMPDETPRSASTGPGRQLRAAPQPQAPGSRRIQSLADRPGSLSVGAHGLGRGLRGDPVSGVAGGTAGSLAANASSGRKRRQYQLVNIIELMRQSAAVLARGSFAQRIATSGSAGT